MKKTFSLCILLILVFCLFGEDFMQPSHTRQAVRSDEFVKRVPLSQRDVPNYEFITEPTFLTTSYYDYMPGSYNSLPIRLQEDAQGGMYIVFHATETAAATRREYYAYIDNTGSVTSVATVTSEDIREGYGGIAIDPDTGDPFVAYHIKFADPTGSEVLCTYDLFHLGSPGLWKAPFTVIDRTIPTTHPDDDFVWPYVHIGPSPIADKRRVFIFGNNYTSHQASGNPSENTLIGYADFDDNDLNMQSELDWTYTTIPIMDDWNQGIPEEIRPYHSYAVSDDGQVAIMGYNSIDELFVFLNDNYGEGDYEYYNIPIDFDIDNPQNQDGTYRFIDPDTGLPHELYMAPQLCNHMNAIFTSDNTKLRFLGSMNMLLRPDLWYPDYSMKYPKMFTFDIANEEFSFSDLYVTGANPYDNVPMVPWDLDEDGAVDEFDPDGNVTWVGGWPIYFDDADAAFHENYTKLAYNEEHGIVAAVWSDGLKQRYAVQGEPAYAGWETYPEIAIAISTDNGETWGEPLFINAKSGDDNYAPEFDGMIPVYIYPGDKIEIIENGPGTADDEALIHLFFFDDNSFGSTIQGFGENLGGSTMYASIKLTDFTSAHNTTVPLSSALSQNYPNPFNPETNIRYSLKNSGHVTIEIFNIQGQKVKTLLNRSEVGGDHVVVWDGISDDGAAVSSGVYFYKMQADGTNTTKKMLLLK
ncbi:MAG: hypothetical protein B1H06_01805 [Candidatus Cloacimonas sp. 4484_143]|nr:MAG: hypothetical protein B1H06_01805 [Candidatus Cloacimonas sp. 4484_143]